MLTPTFGNRRLGSEVLDLDSLAVATLGMLIGGGGGGGCQGRLKTARSGGWLVGDLLSFASEPVTLSVEDDDLGVVD